MRVQHKSRSKSNLTPVCSRCHERPVEYTSRSDDFCTTCYVAFIRTKQRKQMEEFKVNYAPGAQAQHILLMLSLGPASVALLDLMVESLQKQKEVHKGKVGYELHAVFVDDRALRQYNNDVDDLVRRARQRFPECQLSVVPIDKFASEQPEPDWIHVQDNSGNVIQASGIVDFLKSINTRSSYQDMVRLVVRRMGVLIARSNGWQTVIYGDSMTRLAESVISLTAQGRGQSIPSEIFPETVDPAIKYPMREILAPEVRDYVKIRELEDLVAVPAEKIPATTRLQSIDELVKQYFVGVEQGFPTIVSTVVRAAAKLAEPETSTDLSCSLCGAPCQGNNNAWLSGITVNYAPGTSSETEGRPTAADPPLCYGCMVMSRDFVTGTVPWARNLKEDVLRDYVLDDDST